MAVRLRLRREGAKKQTHFRVVAADSGAPRDGRFIELLGEYHPQEDPSVINVDAERALYWLRNGARPSNQVRQLLYITGVWEQFRPGTTPDHITVQQPAEEDEAEEAEEAAEPEAAEEGPEPGATEEAETAAEAETAEETTTEPAEAEAGPSPAVETPEVETPGVDTDEGAQEEPTDQMTSGPEATDEASAGEDDTEETA